MEISNRMFNPLGFHLLKWMREPSVRNIILYGGSSSGKTYSIAQVVLLMTMREGSNHIVMRKVGASIKDTIFQDFITASNQLGINRLFKFTAGTKTITCLVNDARIVFKGLDDSEKIKGLSSFKRVIMDEWSEYDESDYRQIRLRLRGMEGQQIITAFNPIKETHWIKRNVFDRQKWHDIPMRVEIAGKLLPRKLTEVKSIRINEPRAVLHKRTGQIVEHPSDTVVIQTTYLNNFWVIGSPNGKYGYYDEQCVATFDYDREHDPDYYNVYALGEWGVIRTGSEFFGSFNRATHCSRVDFDPALPIHLSVDNNVLPYITFTFWQADYKDGIHIRQIDEICAASPDNTVRKASRLVARRIKHYNPEAVYLHGDASTRAANNIDDEKRSWLDLLIDCLAKEGVQVVDCVGNRNPSVAISGEFINAILDGQIPRTSLTIDERCSNSIEDYSSVQKDANGAILKTRVKNKTTMQTYEEHGHISDTARYLITDILSDEFTQFSNRRKRNIYARDGFIRFFNPDNANEYGIGILYMLPNINDRVAWIHGRLCGCAWHIVSAGIEQTVSLDTVRDHAVRENAAVTVLECGDSYFSFVRELRTLLPNVKVKRQGGDIARRVAATSDIVRDRILFDPQLADNDEAYGAFLTNMLDYGRDDRAVEASTAISGFIQFAEKWISR